MARANPSDEGFVWSDEITLNAMLLGVDPTELMRSLQPADGKRLPFLRPVHRRLPDGNTRMIICPHCKAMFRSAEEYAAHRRVLQPAVYACGGR